MAPKRYGTRSLAQLVPPITTKALGRRGSALAGLITKWPEIVGPAISQGSLPKKLVFMKGARGDGTLHIAVASNLATEMQHLEPMLLERINGFLGYGAVKKLRLFQGLTGATARQRPPARRVATATSDAASPDDSLQGALARLGKAVDAAEKAREFNKK